MLTFKQFIIEGGAIKIGGVHASPISITHENRPHVQHDVHHMLSALHDSFHKEHGHHLFGDNKKALHTGSAYSGSTRHLMSKSISHKEFAKHKSTVGDVDTMVPKEHMEKLHKHLTVGKKFGDYEVAGTHKHGVEISALMKHKSGHVHQVDFEPSDYEKHEPSHGDHLLHDSDWHDMKKGIKGYHHKVLLNAAGGDKHKFSNAHGLKSRSDEKDKGTKSPEEITKKLFGDKAYHHKIHSFQGLTDLIKKHVPKEHHQGIYNKFKEATDKNKKADHTTALAHLKDHLL